MMDDKPQNPSAFPGGNPSRYDGTVADGMRLRDWFAGQAIGHIISSAISARVELPNLQMAADAYAIADAMLEARDAKL